MKKLLIGVVAVLATASLASAAVSFSLPANTDVDQDGQVEILVMATGDGAVGGMNLNMTFEESLQGLDAPTYVGMEIATGTAWEGTNSEIDTYLFGAGGNPMGFPNAGFAMANVLAPDGVALEAPCVVARLTVDVTGLPLGGVYTMTTDFGVPSDWSATAAVGDQGSGTITIVPEPASALLLLAAVPFLRRRR